jgi:hypothetical protein
LASTSSDSLIREALSSDRTRALAATRALFTDVIEPLADHFEPADCEAYVRLFAPVLREVFPELAGENIEGRYHRIRRVRPIAIEPRAVFVLSRVTLGADIAVTSIVLDAAKRRFPNAQICFVGPRKNAELFAGDPRIRPCTIPYARAGTLRERLSAWEPLRELTSTPDSLILDPDSRLTQLGLLPMGHDEHHHLFESRSFGGDSTDSLVTLTQKWVAATLGVPDARAYVCTGLEAAEFATTVSFGVGENPAKRVGDPFEEEVLKRLPQPILIDKGAGGEEAERVERAVAASGVDAQFWEGSFAGFAAHIARSGLYAGYDSAGGHAAAACGIPLVSIFTGYPCARMFQRWRPSGPGLVHVVDAKGLQAEEVLALIRL